MAKNDNLNDFLTDIADAIRNKKGTTKLLNPQAFASEIASIQAPNWTGHADVDGLRAIGWTDDDISYFQQYGVNWNEEDDKYHLVSEENKAMYGVINADNIADFINDLVYLPKIDTSGKTSFVSWLYDCSALIAIPMIDTSSATDVQGMCEECRSLSCFPPLDFSKVTNISRLFYNCNSLTYIPPLKTSNVTTWAYFCRYAYSLHTFPDLDTSASTNFNYMFSNCVGFSTIRMMNIEKGVAFTGMLNGCRSARNIFLKGLNKSFSLSTSPALSKESLLYIINNAKASSAMTITLAAHTYAKYSEDADVVAALTNKVKISLASA